MNHQQTAFKNSCIYLLLITCASLISCTPASHQGGQGKRVVSMSLHHDSMLPVTLKLPENWNVEQDDRKQEIRITGPTPGDEATIVAKKVDVSRITLKLLKAFGRIHIPPLVKEGWVQQRYSENILMDGNQAIQYVLRRDSKASITYFTGKDNYIYIITTRGTTTNIATINNEVISGIRFINNPGSTTETVAQTDTPSQPEVTTKKMPSYSASPNIINLEISAFDKARREYDKDISNALPLSQRTKLLEQICFKHAFLKTESLLQVQDNKFRALLKEVGTLHLANRGIPDLARSDALRAYINNNYSEATEKLESILLKDPEDIHAKLYLAMIRPYDSISVESAITEALIQYPDNLLAIYLQSLNYLADGKKRAGHDSLKQILKKNPHNLWLHFAIARNYNSAGNTKQAIQMYTKALELYPQFMATRYSLALILYKEKKYTEAQKHLKILLSEKKDNPDAILLQAMIHKNQGKNSAAKQMFETVLAIDPDNYRALYNIGALCAAKLNDNKCARQAFNRYLSIAPEDNRQSSIISWLKKN